MGAFFEAAGAAISTIIGVLFWIFILRLIFGKARKKVMGKPAKKTAARPAPVPTKKAEPVEKAHRMAEQTPGDRKKAAMKKREQKKLYRKFDTSDERVHDNSDDWLSQQLREEKKLLREMSAMFELKMSHEQHCAADRLREDHARNCDAEKVRKSSRS